MEGIISKESRLIRSLRKIIEYASLDRDIKRFFKQNGFDPIYDEIALDIYAENTHDVVEATFTTKKLFMKFTHPYTITYKKGETEINKEKFVEKNIVVSFKRANCAYTVTFNPDNYQKFFDEDLRNKHTALDINNTFLKIECIVNDAEIGETSKFEKRMHICYNKDVMVVEDIKYDKEIDVLNETPYNHPVLKEETKYDLKKIFIDKSKQ